MSFIANLLWFLLGGWAWGLIMALGGILWCLSIVGIPFGLATLRLAGFICCPFGKELVDARDFGEERIFGTGVTSAIWIACYGLWAAIGLGLCGLSYCCTIIGIPFGLAYFKIASAAFNPLGKRVVSTDVARAIRARKVDAILDTKLGIGDKSTQSKEVESSNLNIPNETSVNATSNNKREDSRPLQNENPRKYLAMTILMCFFSYCVLLFGLIVGVVCFNIDVAPLLATHVVLPPPVKVDVRKGILSDVVLLAYNRSNNPQKIRIYIYEGEWWTQTELLTLDAHDEKVIGMLEFSGKWRPKVGNRGFVHMNGFSDMLYFELKKEGIHSEFVKVVPSDFPGQLVRELYVY